LPVAAARSPAKAVGEAGEAIGVTLGVKVV
jgi:hypothetical protein